MKKDSIIYIAGHTGMLGSAIVRNLKKLGYRELLLRTHQELDLTDQKQTESFFKNNRPEYLFMCAGKTGGILANSRYPAEFIYENTLMGINVIHSSYKYSVKKMIYLGCACMYPKYSSQPMKEKYLLTGSIEPTNEPYAIAKILGLKQCLSYNRQYGTNFIPVIGGNVYGPGSKHFDEGGHVIEGLIQRFSDTKRKGFKSVTVWGTGKPKRDFLYVDDIADACIFLMREYNENEVINVGSGKEVSIRTLTNIIKKIVKFKGEIVYDKTKPDGMPRKSLEISKILKLGWRPKADLETGLKLTCKWYKKSISSQ